MSRYIMRNRARDDLPLSHGQRRAEFIVYDDSGAELDRLNVTPATAAWVASSSGLQFTSPAHFYQTVICKEPTR